MIVTFYKYEGAGNDFILIDNRNNIFSGDKKKLAKKICQRHLGVGADGLIFIENSNSANFKIDFLNPDGSRSFCGNGSRCAVSLAKDLNVFSNDKVSFEAFDGVHKAALKEGLISIEMNNVDLISLVDNDYYLYTGSPHYVSIMNNIDDLDMIKFGRSIRFSDKFKDEGTNVNVIEELAFSKLKVRTYERGVENETLACGTGVTACALSYGLSNNIKFGDINIKAVGGDLKVKFTKNDNNTFDNIWLTGPTKFVFKGEYNV